MRLCSLLVGLSTCVGHLMSACEFFHRYMSFAGTSPCRSGTPLRAYVIAHATKRNRFVPKQILKTRANIVFWDEVSLQDHRNGKISRLLPRSACWTCTKSSVTEDIRTDKIPEQVLIRTRSIGQEYTALSEKTSPLLHGQETFPVRTKCFLKTSKPPNSFLYQQQSAWGMKILPCP
jgi:hypothetical protein